MPGYRVTGIRATAFLVFSLALGAQAAVVYVKADASGANNGLSWSSAFANLQSALAVAQSGDQVWVSAGTYKPTNGSDRTISFVMPPNGSIYGGFSGTETSLAERDWKANPVILSGDIGVAGDASDNSLHVVRSETLGYRLDGFTITLGNASGTGDSGDGGGMLNNPSSSPTVIANCTFESNTCERYGAGMRNYLNNVLRIEGCNFRNNLANGGGGAVYNNNGSALVVIDCNFSENICTLAFGGAMYNTQSSPSVTNCSFLSNSAMGESGRGGAIFNNAASPKFTNCVFAGNSANGTFVYTGGGAIYNVDGSSMTVANCTFFNNTAAPGADGTRGGGALRNVNSVPILVNSIFWGDHASVGPEINNVSTVAGMAPSIRNCAIQGSFVGGLWNASLGANDGGNTAADPRFVNALNVAGLDGIERTLDDGLRLRYISPCVDAGRPENAPLFDILGYDRSLPPDMGAYEVLPEDFPNASTEWLLYL